MWKVIKKISIDILLTIGWGFCAVVNLQAGYNVAGILDLILVALWGFITGLDVAITGLDVAKEM